MSIVQKFKNNDSRQRSINDSQIISRLEARNREREQSLSRVQISIESSINNLCFERLNADNNVLEFWKSKQNSDRQLYELSNIILAVPATQVSVERAFSGVGLILTARRTQLGEKTLADIMLVKLNSSLFKSLNISYSQI